MPSPSQLKNARRTQFEIDLETKIKKKRAEGLARIVIADPNTPGLSVAVSPKDHRVWYLIGNRDEGGKRKQVWKRLGSFDEMAYADAQVAAREAFSNVKQGKAAIPIPEPIEPKATPETFKKVAEKFIERHVKKQALRSAAETERIFKTYVYPEWQEKDFLAIRRADVASLLDQIEDQKAGAHKDMGGPVMADRTLAALSKLFSWYQARDDEYVSPVVRGMRRTNAKARARDRVLTDDEIRLLWKAAGGSGQFGAFVKLLLLTAQRRAKVAEMKWADVHDGVWTIPTEEREKGNPGSLRLPKLALDVLTDITPVEGNPYVFTGRGEGALHMGDKLKKDFDEAAGIACWTLHDLRRTAKTLMRRAGISGDISERVLGHAIAGVEGVYDRHSYDDEKRKALESLAKLVGFILNPPANNVRRMRRAI